jgi:hypothetical protein
MQARVEFRLQERVDPAMPVKPAHPGEFFRNHADPHMRLASSRDVWLVTGVLMTFVDNDQPLGFKFMGQKGFDPGSD